MSENTKIEWCDHTFNPWEGCQKVGPGCGHCYAEARNARFAGGTAVNWGPGAPRRRTSPANWRKPISWNARPFLQCRACGWRGDQPGSANGLVVCPEVRCASFNLVIARRRVFCASLADVFDNAVDPAWRADLFDLIEKTPNLDWLLLTKRIGNVLPMISETAARRFDLDCLHEPRLPDNVWLGATIVDQVEADRDIPKLLAVPARVRFLSMEPLLGPVDLRQAHIAPVKLPRVDWVIVGGESGPGARPMHPDWARSLRDQCAAAGVAFHFKQHGEWAPGSGDFGAGRFETAAIAHNGHVVAGGYRVEDYLRGAASGDGWAMVHRTGKRTAGRLLDGHTHDEFPEAR
ncbi:phage Gp37/Gp68 family protein [Burkholderia vietnamiensis]|jgi:protein gp37|uniref:phage Gp37/Gp68 family protein n=1 Tax=Burkholderia vietnamiensis TaxID=60552 RepID=UPI0010412FCA|nr:phage Gp37/Gp68 family protein [Burkholderia vietnamiensis]